MCTQSSRRKDGREDVSTSNTKRIQSSMQNKKTTIHFLSAMSLLRLKMKFSLLTATLTLIQDFNVF